LGQARHGDLVGIVYFFWLVTLTARQQVEGFQIKPFLLLLSLQDALQKMSSKIGVLSKIKELRVNQQKQIV